MKRKGFTLIEMIISLGLLSILFLSIMGIFGQVTKNIGANAQDINNANLAKTELNLAIQDKNYLGANSQLENTEKTVNVLGTDVTVRYINSPVENGTNGSYSIYVTDGVRVIIDPKPPVDPDPENPTPDPEDKYEQDGESNLFFDFDGDGKFDEGSEESYIKEDSLNDLEYTGDADIVVNGDIDRGRNDINIDTINKIVINPGCGLETDGSMNLSGSDVIVNADGAIETKNNGDLIINVDNDVDLNANATITSNNNSNVVIDCNDFTAKDMSNIDLKNGGDLQLNARNDITLENGAFIEIKNGNPQHGNSVEISSGNNIKLSNSYITAGNNTYINIVSANELKLQENALINTEKGPINITCFDLIVDNSIINAESGDTDAVTITATNNVMILNGGSISSRDSYVNVTSCLNFLADNGVIDISNNIKINAIENVNILNNSKINSSRGLLELRGRNFNINSSILSCNDDEMFILGSNRVNIYNNSIIQNNGGIINITSTDFDIYESSIIGRSCTIKGNTATLSGSRNRKTTFDTSRETVFDIQANGVIYYGKPNETSAYLNITGNGGYLVNKNNTPYQNLQPTVNGNEFK